MSSQQYFLFISNNDIYAIETCNVVEIVEYQQITKVPMLRSFVKGVTNIRGNIIAVIDLLERFGFEESKISEKTSLVILKIFYNEEEMHLAVIIDEVYEVDNIKNENIEVTPDFGIKIQQRFVKNMLQYNKEYIPILDINTVLSIDDLAIKAEIKG